MIDDITDLAESRRTLIAHPEALSQETGRLAVAYLDLRHALTNLYASATTSPAPDPTNSQLLDWTAYATAANAELNDKAEQIANLLYANHRAKTQLNHARATLAALLETLDPFDPT